MQLLQYSEMLSQMITFNHLSCHLSYFSRNIQYCPNGPICPKTSKVQDSFEFLQFLGYITLHYNVVKKTWVSFIHIYSSSCAFKYTIKLHLILCKSRTTKTHLPFLSNNCGMILKSFWVNHLKLMTKLEHRDLD